jgi:hypothetical protein
METQKSNKLLKSIYSLKKKKTVSNLKQSPSIFSLNSQTLKQGSSVSRSQKSTYFDQLRPVESLKAVTEHKEKLSNLYKSRLLPSQFLSTPADVIERLTENLYFQPRKSEKWSDSEREKDFFYTPILKLEPKSLTQQLKKQKTVDSHAFLNASCKQILEDNKKSRKTLKMATVFLEKRAVINNILTKNLEKIGKSASMNDFEERLKEAHDQLVKKDRIPGKKRESTQNILFSTVSSFKNNY